MSETPLEQSPGRTSGWSRVWAPVAAALVIGIIYWPRVDSVFYFLHGNEAQGLLLASAIADGQGFVDLALPGHPAHVREPPLFYFMLAGLIKLFEFRLFPLKLLMGLGYVVSAAAGAVLFQRRVRPWLAFFTVIASLSATELFIFFTGPKSDIPFTALCLLSLIAIESLLNRMPGAGAEKAAGSRSSRSIFMLGAGAVVCMLATIFMRSLGLALLLAALGAVILWRRDRIPLRVRIKRGLAVAAPVILVLIAWNLHLSRTPNPAGFTYLDWFRMDLKPGSPEMMAVDFHAPLMTEIPQSSPGELIHRVARHAWYYPIVLFNSLTDRLTSIPVLPLRPASTAFIAAVIASCALFLFGLYRMERSRPPVIPIFLITYLGAALVWPMDDPRLLYPLYPLACFYTAAGFHELISGGDRKGALSHDRMLIAGLLTFILLAALVAVHCHRNFSYQRAASKFPTVSYQPGFHVRFVSREVMDSFRLLEWARDNTPPDSVLMYHSSPPCRLISQRACSPIPFIAGIDRLSGPEKTRELMTVREYIISQGIDYLLLDEYDKAMPEGPGWFVKTMLRPLAETFKSDFQRVDDLPGDRVMALEVRPQTR